jgi:ABC-2 type transport system permease protein
MPSWLQAFVAVNPVTLLVTAIRSTMSGSLTIGELGLALLAPALATAICAPLAMLLYARK